MSVVMLLVGYDCINVNVWSWWIPSKKPRAKYGKHVVNSLFK